MKRLLPAAFIVLSFSVARADDPSGQAAAEKRVVRSQTADQKGLQTAAVRQLQAAPLKVGQSGPAQFSKGVMTNSASWLKQSLEIPRFINENGCTIKDGKYATVRMNCPAAAANGAPVCVSFSKLVDEVAKNTEVVYVDKVMMKKITGRADAIAFGVTKELKKELRNPDDPNQPIVVGAANMNSIALRGDPVDASQKAPEDGIFSLVLAHEFLHIALRQVDNAALGGGARKDKADPDIAITHHRLTDFLKWKAVSWDQGGPPWTPGSGQDECAKAGQPAAP